MNALQKLKQLIEKGARNSANDSKMIQTMHDHSVSLGAQCSVSEAGDFSQNDVMTLLNTAVRKQFKDKYSYPYICDVFDDYLVFMADYSNSTCYRVDYSVDDSGTVVLGEPTAVVRKVTYIEPNTVATESDSADLVGDCVQLVETVDNFDLREANTRMLKLIAPGWGSSGYYPADVLKRDGPKIFKSGTHNYIDHPTPLEDKERPEGSLNKLASVLKEDATWFDDYKGNGPGLYAKAKVSDEFGKFLDNFGNDIGMSIRASGKVKNGEADGKKGSIIEAITAAKSVDYVTMAGAGGKVLELFESAKNNVNLKENGETNMPTDQDFATLKETVDKLNETIQALATQNARLAESNTLRDARDYAARKLSDPAVKLHAATKARILDSLVVAAPLTEAKTLDTSAFDALIENTVAAEAQYLTSVGAFGKISGFGERNSGGTAPTLADLEKQFEESMKELDA